MRAEKVSDPWKLSVIVVHEEKLLFSLVVLFLMHLYLLPEGSRLTRCCPGRPIMIFIIGKQDEVAMPYREDRGELIILFS